MNAGFSGISTPSSPNGYTVIEEKKASVAVASLDFKKTVSPLYDSYAIEFTDVMPSTDGANLYMRMSIDGGSSYDAGSNYGWNAFVYRAADHAVAGSEGGAAFINLTNYSVRNTNALFSLNGFIHLFSPLSKVRAKSIIGMVNFLDTVNFRLGVLCRGSYEVATPVNAFQFLFSSGNIASGVIRTYGIRSPVSHSNI